VSACVPTRERSLRFPEIPLRRRLFLRQSTNIITAREFQARTRRLSDPPMVVLRTAGPVVQPAQHPSLAPLPRRARVPRHDVPVSRRSTSSA
jgi:hypothetical protein